MVMVVVMVVVVVVMVRMVKCLNKTDEEEEEQEEEGDDDDGDHNDDDRSRFQNNVTNTNDQTINPKTNKQTNNADQHRSGAQHPRPWLNTYRY